MTTTPRASWRPGPCPPHRPRLQPHHPARSHFQDACAGGTGGDHGPAGTATCSTAARHTLPNAHPVTTQAAGLHRAIRRQLDTGKHAARCSPATLAPPTSPTPELAHMAVRLWPIDRPASHAESAGRMWVSAPALLPRFCGDVGVGSGTGSRPDLRVGRRRWGCLDNDLSAGRTPACISPS